MKGNLPIDGPKGLLAPHNNRKRDLTGPHSRSACAPQWGQVSFSAVSNCGDTVSTNFAAARCKIGGAPT